MSIATTVLITELRVNLGNLDIDELSDTDALLLLNRSFWETQNKFKFKEIQAQNTLATVASTATIALPADYVNVEIIGVLNADTKKYEKLTRMSLLEYENWKQTDTNLYARPTHYMMRGNNIVLYPTPDKVYSIDMYNKARLQDLSAIGNLTIPQEWHEIILMGATYRGYIRNGDFERSRSCKSEYLSLIESTVPVETKEQIDSDKAHVEVPSRTTYRI